MCVTLDGARIKIFICNDVILNVFVLVLNVILYCKIIA